MGPNRDKKSDRVFLFILFEYIAKGTRLAVGTMHLKSRPKNRHIRVVEIAEYLERLNEFLVEIQEAEQVTKEEVETLPIIITGDFNDEPDSPVVLSMEDLKLTKGLRFSSAYCIDGVYPEYTTYKYRSEDVIKHVIDYIFYSENSSPLLKLKSIREMPEEEDIPENIGNPCHRCASDHFSLAATFEF